MKSVRGRLWKEKEKKEREIIGAIREERGARNRRRRE